MSNEIPRQRSSSAFRMQAKSAPFKIQSEAQSTGAKWFGFTVATCAAVSVVMLTVKFAFVLFG